MSVFSKKGKSLVSQSEGAFDDVGGTLFISRALGIALKSVSAQ